MSRVREETGLVLEIVSRETEARLAVAGCASLVDPNAGGVIQYVNPAFVGVTGYSADDVVGQTPRVLKSGKHDAAFYAGLWATIQSGRIWRGDLVNRRKDGTLFEEAASIAPVMDEQAVITHFVAVKSDVTLITQRIFSSASWPSA